MRRLFRTGFAAFCIVTLSAGAARAQAWDRLTNPSVKVPITHPPQVVLTNVTKVAVLDFTGSPRCGPDLTVRLSQSLQQMGQFQMIDRRSLDAILTEQNLQRSGAVSPQTRARIGELLGPAALFTGRVTRCVTDVSGLLKAGETKQKNGTVKTRYIRRATGHLTAQVSLVDVATGQIHAGDLIDLTDTLVTEAIDADPVPPSVDQLRSNLFAAATAQMQRIVLPWDEIVSLVVYDDDKCGLKSSAAQIKRGQLVQAAAALQTSIGKACDAPKDNNALSKALYNFGIALTYSNRPDEGLKALQASADLRKSGITDEAIAATNKIISLNEARRRATEEANLMDAQAAGAGSAQAALTNKDIIEMSSAKLSDAIIVAKIRSSACRFDVSTSGLIALKQAGVSDAVILEVTDAAGTKCR